MDKFRPCVPDVGQPWRCFGRIRPTCRQFGPRFSKYYAGSLWTTLWLIWTKCGPNLSSWRNVSTTVGQLLDSSGARRVRWGYLSRACGEQLVPQFSDYRPLLGRRHRNLETMRRHRCACLRSWGVRQPACELWNAITRGCARGARGWATAGSIQRVDLPAASTSHGDAQFEWHATYHMKYGGCGARRLR